MLEVWSDLTDILKARVFTNHGLHSVEQRIEHNLKNTFINHAWPTHGWMKRHNNVTLNAYADLFYHHAESSLDLIEVLPSTREILNTMVGIVKDKWVDNDFAHFLRRAQMGDIVWNPDKNLFEKISRSEEIKIKFIEPEHSYVEYLLGHSVKADFIESVPSYIEISYLSLALSLKS